MSIFVYDHDKWAFAVTFAGIDVCLSALTLQREAELQSVHERDVNRICAPTCDAIYERPYCTSDKTS